MKSKTRIIFGLICLMTLFTTIMNVSAGSVNVGFSGNDTVVVNNNIDITVKVSDINGLTDGLATAQGDISFDSNYLEYVKHEDVSSDLSVSYGTKTQRFVALGLSGEYIASADNLLKITFKAKTIGETTININNVVIGDTKAIIHSSNVISKTITIVGESSDSTTDDTTPSTPSNPSTEPSNNGGSTGGSTSSKSSDANLLSLIVNNAKVTPVFDKNNTSYYVVVSKDVDELQLDYVTSSKNAKVVVKGNKKLKDNESNVVSIIVTAEDGSTKTYTLNVTKSDDESDNKLKDLIVKESEISFDEDEYEYNIKVGSDVDKLTIDAIAKSKDSKVEIIGNSKLSKGNNVVLIKLTDKKGFTNYYKLNVEKDDAVRLFGIDVKWIIFWLLLLLLLLILIILLFKRRKKDDDDDKKEKDKEEPKIYITKEAAEKLKSFKSSFKSEEENVDVYDDVVTKDELIDAIEERNAKKLKMLLVQEKANKLKAELIKEESEDNN